MDLESRDKPADGSAAGGSAIDRSSSRAIFAQLLAEAVSEQSVPPSPMALVYLLELLETRLRAPTPVAVEADSTLGETLMRARLERGPTRVAMLRALGDRTLFVAGIFGDSLRRSLVGLDYYGEVGRAAYSDVSAHLAARAPEPIWSELFQELAQGFPTFVELLAGVGDRTRGDAAADLLKIYQRYLETHSRRDHARLLRLGIIPIASTNLGTRQ